MKQFILYGIITILSISTTVFAYKYYQQKPNYHKMAATPDLDSMLSLPPLAKYKDTQGIEHFVVSSDVHTIVEKEKSEQAAIIAPIIEKLAQELSIPAKDIQSSTTVSTETIAKQVSLQRTIDSLKMVTLYYKRKWFLASKESFTDISSNDPRTTIKGYKTFTVKQKEPTFGLRVQAVGGYNIPSNTFFTGPSIRFDIKNTSFRLSYLYSTLSHKWTPTVATEYNIIKF